MSKLIRKFTVKNEKRFANKVVANVRREEFIRETISAKAEAASFLMY